MNNSENQPKKKRTRRSPEKMAELVLEAERIGQSKVCKREGKIGTVPDTNTLAEALAERQS